MIIGLPAQKNVLFLILLALFLYSCHKPNRSQTEITFWAMGAEGENVGRLLPQFESTHLQIKIKLQTIPWASAHEKLLTAVAGQSTPDICQLGNTWISEFQAIGVLLPLDSLIRQSQVIKPAAYFEGIWHTNQIGSRIYGVPWYVDTRLLFYRKDVLAQLGYTQPPQTWDEWLTIARKIKLQFKKDEKKFSVFFSLIFNDWPVPVILIMANGGRLLKDNDCRAAFDDPATVAALQFYLQFFAENLAPKNMTEVSNIFQGFSTEFFSMFITGPWNVSEMRKRLPELNGRWGTTVMPLQKNRHSVAGGSSLIIFNNSKAPTAAWQFIEFLSTATTQTEFFRLTKDLPAVREAWQAPELREDQEIRAFYEQLENVESTPKIAEWEQVAVKIQAYLEQVVFGKMTLAEAIPKLNRDVNQILAKRRWLLSRHLLDSNE